MPRTVTQRDFTRGFFDDRLTKDAIDEISRSHRVTIFAGAGVASDQGYPSWSGLVTKMLGRRLREHLPKSNDAELVRVANNITNQYYQIPTATIIDQLYREQSPDDATAKDRRNQDLKQVLYETNRDIRPVKPSLIEEILVLAFTLKAANISVHIVTTNYDDLFEKAAAESEELAGFEDWGLGVATFAKEPPTDEDNLDAVVPIVHVHGFLPRDDVSDSDVVFSEVDYINWDDGSKFRHYLAQAFSKGTVLMVGTSLRDNNIAAKLRLNRSDDCKRFALVPTQSEVEAVAEFGAVFGRTVASFAQYRGAQLGTVILRPDFYGQVLQFLREVALEVSKATGDSTPSRYADRLRHWSAAWRNASYADTTKQQQASEQLAKLGVEISKRCGVGILSVKLSLWVRTDVEARVLELWCDSQAVRQIQSSSYRPHTVSIAPLIDHPAVRCFASRSAVDGRLPGAADRRWTHHLAVPVQDASRVTVGVLVASMQAPGNEGKDWLPTVRTNWQLLTSRMTEVAEPLVAI